MRKTDDEIVKLAERIERFHQEACSIESELSVMDREDTSLLRHKKGMGDMVNDAYVATCSIRLWVG